MLGFGFLQGRKITGLTIALVVLMAILITSPSFAEEAGSGALFEDADEAARQTSNPLGGDFMVLINEWNFDFYDGDLPDADDQMSVVHIFQPVIPFSMAETIGPDWILVNRPTLPIIYSADVPSGVNFNPVFPPGEKPSGSVNYDQKSGFGDISHFSLLGTSVASENALLGKGDRVLAGGFSLNIPSGNSTFTAAVRPVSSSACHTVAIPPRPRRVVRPQGPSCATRSMATV